MRKLIAIALVLCSIFALCGCGSKDKEPENNNSEQQKNPAAPLDISTLGQQMIEKMGVSMLPLPENVILNQYGLSNEDCAQMQVYSDYDGTKCNELWLVEAKDAAALEEIQNLAQTRVDSLLGQSLNYNEDVYAASEKARIEVRGMYLALVVTTNGDSNAVMDLFLNA